MDWPLRQPFRPCQQSSRLRPYWSKARVHIKPLNPQPGSLKPIVCLKEPLKPQIEPTPIPAASSAIKSSDRSLRALYSFDKLSISHMGLSCFEGTPLFFVGLKGSHTKNRPSLGFFWRGGGDGHMAHPLLDGGKLPKLDESPCSQHQGLGTTGASPATFLEFAQIWARFLPRQ